MKTHRYLFLLALLFSACTHNTIQDDEFDKVNTNSDTNVATSNLIRIKFTEEFINSIYGCEDTIESNTIIEQLTANLGASRVEQVFNFQNNYNVRWHKAGLDRWYNLYFDNSINRTRAYNELTISKDVLLIENETYIPYSVDKRFVRHNRSEYGILAQNQNNSPQISFNDPLLSQQWSYHNDGSLPKAISGADANVVQAWQFTTGDPSVIVCVIDEGIDIAHQDLSSNIWVNEVELYGIDGVDDDGNGYIDDINGWNFQGENNIIEKGAHGTHVAGTIAAVNNNGLGGCGVAGGDGTVGSGIRMMSCQIFTDGNGSSDAQIAKAIVYGADNGAVIANNSWGYRGSSISTLLAEAIEYFIQYAGTDEQGVHQVGPMKGGIFIAGAGNDNRTTGFMPATYDNSLSVGAMAPDFVKSSFSNYGTWIDIMAPGGDTPRLLDVEYGVLSTTPDDTYSFYYGTSMATPHVSGIAALAVSYYGVGKSGLTSETVQNMILESVEDIYQYNIPSYKGRLGVGYINAYNVLTQVPEYEDLPPGTVKNINIIWNFHSVDLRWGITSDLEDGKASYYDIAFSTSKLTNIDFNAPPASAQIISIATNDLQMGDILTATFDNLNPGRWGYLAIAARDSKGNRSDIEYYSGKTMPEPLPIDMQYLTLGISRSILLQEYFNSDIPLVFTADSSDEEIVGVAIREGGRLSLTPVHYGVSSITVKATTASGDNIDWPVNTACRDWSQTVDLYPVPVKKVLNIRMGADILGEMNYTLTNSKGVKILSNKCTIESPCNPIVVDMSSCVAGVYSVEVCFGETTVKRTITKL